MTKFIEIHNILDVEKHLEGIDAVIFDLDDTLYSEKDYVRSGFNAVANEFPDISNMSDKLWSAFEMAGNAIDVVFESEGILTNENKEKALRIYRSQEPEIKLYEGVAEMIARLKRVGIITDGRPEGQHKKIMSLGLVVEDILVTDEFGGIEFRKPNEKAFRVMQKRMNVPFENMAYVGDNPNKDFIAPRDLGMLCIYFRNPDGLYSIKHL